VVAGIGIIMLVAGIIRLIVYDKCKNIMELIDKGMYSEARSEVLIWMVISFVMLAFIVGILLLIAYIELGEAEKLKLTVMQKNTV